MKETKGKEEKAKLGTDVFTERTADHQKQPEDESDLLYEARKRYDEAYTFDQEQRDACADDLRFAYDPEEQWEDYVLAHRTGRPCLTLQTLLSQQ